MGLVLIVDVVDRSVGKHTPSMALNVVFKLYLICVDPN